MDRTVADALARLAAGVVVIGTAGRSGFRGLTATSFTAVSAEPPLVIVCVDSLAQSRDAVARAGSFGVSVLERSQEFVAERFAGRAPLVDPAWLDVPHEVGANGAPLVRGAVAWLECRLEQLLPAGDHDIAVGRVTAATTLPGEPLVLWDRAFWSLG